MIHAYDRTYLERARSNLGRMLDFTVHELSFKLNEFFDIFIASGVADSFERGEPRLIVGMSGVELAHEVLERSGINAGRARPKYPVERSVEYWVGWALAYYQWETSLSFAEITGAVPIDDIALMYHPYHEMDIRAFAERMTELYRAARPETKLKILRARAGLSQRQLSKQSSVPLRTIQQYEQRQKPINSAKAATVLALSRALCCDMEDLLERVG